MRYDALAYLLEIAPKDGRSIDPEVLKAFTEATSDPNPRVRSYAEFAVGGGLVGDEDALRQVYIGTVLPDVGEGFDVQPPSPEEATGASQHEGALDEHGVFIGVTKVGSPEEQQALQPACPEFRQKRGAMDEHGVFIGVVVPPIGAEQQSEAVTINSTPDQPSD